MKEEEGTKVAEISTELFIRPPSKIVRQFTKYYIEQGFVNGAEAARKAGSKAKNPNHIAHQWLKEPWVRREIEIAKELISKGENPLKLVNEEDIMTKLTRIYEESMENQKYAEAIKSVELMGKQIGMFANRTENLTLKKIVHEGNDGKVRDEDRMDMLINALTATKKIKKIETIENMPVKEEAVAEE